MRIEIVKNTHGRFTYEIDGVREHNSWPALHLARRAALREAARKSAEPVKPVKAKESANELPAV